MLPVLTDGSRDSGYLDWAILAQADAGHDSEVIADNLNLPPGYVETALRKAADVASILDVLTREQLAQLPPVESLIDNTLDRRTMAILGGYWGTGKTFLALDWACSVASGAAWNGRAVRKAGSVLYVVAEGAYGFDARVSAWEAARGARADQLLVIPKAVNLTRTGDTCTVAEYAVMRRAELVIVDTLSRCIVGADENAAKDMSAVVANLDIIRSAGDGRTVLVVHHTGKDKQTMRGSSVLEGAADTVYQMEKSSGGRTKVERTKRKDGPREDQFSFVLSTEAGSRAPVPMVDTDADITAGAARLLSIFMSTYRETGVLMSELRSVSQQGNSTFNRAVNSLVSSGRLRRTGTVGSYFLEEAQ